MVSHAGDVRRSEAKTVWLLVGLLVLVFVVVPLWIRYGGSSGKPLPPMPENPVATLQSGEKIAWAAGDLSVGDGIVCETHGTRVGAWVPKPGHKTVEQFAGSDWTSTISIRVKDDGVVIARCA